MSVPSRFSVGRVGGISLGVAAVVLVAVISIGFSAPGAMHPFFYFGLVFLGAGAFSLLCASVGPMMVRSRAAMGVLTVPFVAGLRRAVLAMWICAAAFDVLGLLIVLSLANDPIGFTPLGSSTVVIAILAAVLTVACAGMNSIVTRRSFPLARA